jgi:membrane protease YdiL (CAAX protease family)
MNHQQDTAMTGNAGTESASKGPSIPWDYFALAYAFSWTFWGLAYLVMRNAPAVSGNTEDLLAAAPPIMLVFVLLGVFGPFFSAFFLTWRRQGRAGAAALWKSGWNIKLGWIWLLVALLLYPVIRYAALILGGAGVSFESFNNPLTLVGMGLFMYFLGGPFGEEFGWRGYALPRLLQNFSMVNASLIIGIFWICWHLPLFVIPGSPQAQIPFWPWALGVVAMATIMTWIHVNVGGIVFAAIILHFSANWANDLFQPATEVASGWGAPDGIAVIIQVMVALLLIPILIRASKKSL